MISAKKLHMTFLAVLMLPVAANAVPIMNNTGLASPDSVITFDEIVLAQGASVINQYAGLGVTFSPELYYDTQGPTTFPGIDGHYLGNFSPTQNPFSINFTGAVTAAAFGVATNPATSTFSAYYLGSLVESFSAATNFNGTTDSYFGFAGIVFDEIRVSVSSDLMLIDNIQFTSVSEPGILVLLGMGLLSLAATRRRKSA